jgi:hypothetical protein
MSAGLGAYLDIIVQYEDFGILEASMRGVTKERLAKGEHP